MSNSALKDSLQQELAEGYVKIGDVEGNPIRLESGRYREGSRELSQGADAGNGDAETQAERRNALREIARIHQKIGTVLPFAGKGPEALQEINEAVRLYQQVLAANPDDVQAKVDLSSAYEAQGDMVGGAQAINLGRKDEAAASYQQGSGTVARRSAESQAGGARGPWADTLQNENHGFVGVWKSVGCFAAIQGDLRDGAGDCACESDGHLLAFLGGDSAR